MKFNKKAMDSSIVKLILLILLGLLIFVAVMFGLRKKLGVFLL